MEHIDLGNLIFIDIETVSAHEDFSMLPDNWKQLWEKKITKLLPGQETAENYYAQRSAIYAEFAKIVCISFGYFTANGHEKRLRIKSIYSENEKELLSRFCEMLGQFEKHNRGWIFAGHNIKEFDIPFLSRRMLINGMSIPSCMNFQSKKPWETNILDTLHMWRFGDFKNYTSLDLLAAAMGVPSPKDDIDGSMVGHVFWKEKDLKRIAVYCQKDVVTVANIIQRFKGLPLLSEDEIEFVD